MKVYALFVAHKGGLSVFVRQNTESYMNIWRWLYVTENYVQTQTYIWFTGRRQRRKKWLGGHEVEPMRLPVLGCLGGKLRTGHQPHSPFCQW